MTIPEAIPGNLYEELMFDGKVTVVPIRPNVQTNYYNENKLNEYGLTPPKNWDELLDFAKTLHEKEGVGRVAIQAASGSVSYTHLDVYKRQRRPRQPPPVQQSPPACHGQRTYRSPFSPSRQFLPLS